MRMDDINTSAFQPMFVQEEPNMSEDLKATTRRLWDDVWPDGDVDAR